MTKVRWMKEKGKEKEKKKSMGKASSKKMEDICRRLLKNSRWKKMREIEKWMKNSKRWKKEKMKERGRMRKWRNSLRNRSKC